MNTKAIPPIYSQPIPMKKVGPGLWEVTPSAESTEIPRDSFRKSALFQKLEDIRRKRESR